MRPTTFIRSLHPLAAAALMVACSGGSDTARAQAPEREACPLLPASVVAEILGGEVETEEHGIACGYYLEPKDPEFPIPDLGIQVTWSGGKAAAEKEVEGAGDKLRPVDGLGDGAWVSRYVGQLSLLLVDDVLVMFHMAMMEGVGEAMMDTDWPELEKRFRELAEAVLAEL
jgi:hypothetical protein